MNAISFRAKQVRVARASACDQLQGVALRAKDSARHVRKSYPVNTALRDSRVIYALEAAKGRKDNFETR
jgi:hypothetical protein